MGPFEHSDKERICICRESNSDRTCHSSVTVVVGISRKFYSYRNEFAIRWPHIPFCQTWQGNPVIWYRLLRAVASTALIHWHFQFFCRRHQQKWVSAGDDVVWRPQSWCLSVSGSCMRNVPLLCAISGVLLDQNFYGTVSDENACRFLDIWRCEVVWGHRILAFDLMWSGIN